jgi:hypothetical protein
VKVPEHCLDKLRAAGLLVSEPFVPNHLAYPDGVIVGKPNTLLGNCIAGSEGHWGMNGPIVDAPCPRLHHENGRWLVTVHEYIPGPGPGDFVNVWATPEEAVEDILDYLLGNPERMQVKQREHAEFMERLAQLIEDKT